MKNAELISKIDDGSATVGQCREYIRRTERKLNQATCAEGHIGCALVEGGPCINDVLTRPGVDHDAEAAPEPEATVGPVPVGGPQPPKDIDEVIARRAALPGFSRRVYDAIHAGLYAEPGFTDVTAEDVAKTLGCKPLAVNGALSKLEAVGLVWSYETDVNFTDYVFLATYQHSESLGDIPEDVLAATAKDDAVAPPPPADEAPAKTAPKPKGNAVTLPKAERDVLDDLCRLAIMLEKKPMPAKAVLDSILENADLAGVLPTFKPQPRSWQYVRVFDALRREAKAGRLLQQADKSWTACA